MVKAKKILSILLWFLTAAAIITILAVSRHKYRNATVRDIVVTKEYSEHGSFLNDSLIIASILPMCDTGVSLMKDIDIEKIEDSLRKNPWIESVKAYTGVDRELNINIVEHKAALRLFDREGNSAYISTKGIIFPISENLTPHVMIASGNFGNIEGTYGNDAKNLQQELLFSEILMLTNGEYKKLKNTLGKFFDITHSIILTDEALTIAESLKKNDFMNACIGQIYLNKDHEFELIPNTTNNIPIIVGNADNIDDKILRASIFLEKKIDTEEFASYSKMNAKYKNQIVCTKK